MTEDKLIWVFSMVSGEIYKIYESEYKTNKKTLLPLKEKLLNCKKCYGRGYIGKNSITHNYILCNCLKRNVDLNLFKDEEIVVETPKLAE